MVPFGAQSCVAQLALSAVLDGVVTRMRFGKVRRRIGGDGVSQIAQTNNTLFCHAEATEGARIDTRIAVFACK